jgi:hypothetical protein
LTDARLAREPNNIASVGWAKAHSTVPTKAFRKALMSRYRRLKIEGGAFFYMLALADRGSDLLGRVLINSAQCPLRSESDRLLRCREMTLWANRDILHRRRAVSPLPIVQLPGLHGPGRHFPPAQLAAADHKRSSKRWGRKVKCHRSLLGDGRAAEFVVEPESHDVVGDPTTDCATPRPHE